MTRPSGLPWIRLLAEGAAIVLSILLAFAIEAWWDGTQERQREQVILAGLLEDFRETQTDLARIKADHQQIFGGARALLEITGPGATNPGRADSLLALAFAYEEFIPTQGTLSSLINSEGLGVISDSELRIQLSDWSQLMGHLEDLTELTQGQLNGELAPYLRSRIPYSNLESGLWDFDLDVPTSRFEFDLDPILSDLEFENLIFDRVWFEYWYLDVLGRIGEASARIVGALEAELGG